MRNIGSEASRQLGAKEIKNLMHKTLLKRDYRNYSGVLPRLEEMVCSGKKIILHGAGWHTSQLLCGASETLLSSIVAITDEMKAGMVFYGFSVLSSMDIMSLDFDCVCMSTDIHQNSMTNELLKLGVEREKIINLYKPAKAELRDFVKGRSKPKVEELLVKIRQSKNPCIIISNSMGLNHPRIFKYLSRDYDLFVVTSSAKIQSLDIGAFSQIFNICILDSVLDLIDLASKLDVGFVITINGIYWNSLGSVCTLVCKRPIFAWFVDFLSSAYKTSAKLDLVCNAKNELTAEEVLWRYSTGVIHKESAELAAELVGRYQPKSIIQFPDYCDDEVVVKPKETTSSSISFVYAGGLLSPKAGDPNCNHHLSILSVVKKLTSMGHSFSIYNAYDEGLTEDWACYSSIEAPFFSYHHAISIFDLPRELSKFDIGIVLFDFSADGVESSGYYKYGGFSKIMAYIEAEIPIIISKETEFMADLVDRHGIGMAVTWGEIDHIFDYLTQENIQKWKTNIKQFKQIFSYNTNMHKLTDFMSNQIKTHI